MKHRFSFKRKFVDAAYETDTDETDDTKRQYRNLSEKKRRDEFNGLVAELSAMVSTSSRKLDKSTVLESTIVFLKNYNKLNENCRASSDETWFKPCFLRYEEFIQLMLEALEAFFLVFCVTTGKIIYASENISSLLGYSAHSLSYSVFQLIHENDDSSLRDLLQNGNITSDINLYLRMKHGPIHFPHMCGFEPVNLTGFIYKCANSPQCSNSCSAEAFPTKCQSYVVALVRIFKPTFQLEMAVYNDTKKEFVSKHNLEWKFLSLDHRASLIIGYFPFEVLGTLVYDYYHVDDLDKMVSSHKTLMQTGEGTSCFYRFLTKGQQWIWLKTHCYITFNQWSSKPEFVVCTHTVFSYNEVESTFQKKPESIVTSSEVSSTWKKSRRTLSVTSISSQYSDVSTASSLIPAKRRVIDVEPAVGQSLKAQRPIETAHINSPLAISTLASPVVTLSLSEVSNVEISPMVGHIQVSSFQYLQWRYQQLQQQIFMQQEELHRISQQLFAANVATESFPAVVGFGQQYQSEEQENSCPVDLFFTKKM